jgi:hypothetical protein
MTKKTFIVKVPDTEDSERSDPNFAYIAISPADEEFLLKSRDLLASSGFNEIKKYNYRLPVFVCDTEDDVNQCTVNSCNLVITHNDFCFEVKTDKYASETFLERITFRELVERLPDSKTNKISLTDVTEWDSGERIENECLMNPDNGALEVIVLNGVPNGALEREFVTNDSGEEFRVFHDQNNDQTFISPHDLAPLLESINSESPRLG